MKADNGTAGFQLLIKAAGKEQQAQGKVPVVIVTIADNQGDRSIILYSTAEYLNITVSDVESRMV